MRHCAAGYLFALATATSIAQTLPHKTSLSGFKPNVPELSSKAPSKPSSLPNSAPVEMNRMVVVIDPAHGGLDSGARISDATLEKDVTLAIAFKLRSLLSARGLAVVMTRDADISSEPDAEGSSLTLDDRAGIANHAHPMACLLFHATGTGNGVHLYTSELTAIVGQPTVEPWLTAQAAWVPQSENLEKHLAAALTRSRIALVTSRASVRPVDSLACPALIVELAPSGDDPDSINGSDYQERIAQAIAGSLLFWRNQVEPPPHASASAASENIPSIPVKPAPQRGTLR